jgi:L-fuculose-phosphate aldolase
MNRMNHEHPPSGDTIVAAMIDVCRRLTAKNFVAATDGNVSARLPSGNILITPSGVNKGMLTEADLVEVRRDGTVAVGRATTELKMHLFIYERRKDARAIVHAHPPYATAFAVAGIALVDPVLPEVILGLGEIPLAPYATPSTGEVPDSLMPFVEKHNAVLLSNHGAVTFGADLLDAYFKMEKVEQAAAIIYRARMLGRVRTLSDDDVAKLHSITAYPGDHKGRE